ncbi:MAG: histidinol-phosphate transaminase [Gammaproteobacteria bacterium]
MGGRFSQLTAPGVQGLKPYQPGKPIAELEREYGVRDIVKLASNENPFGPSPCAQQRIVAGVADLARYPDANGFELKRALADRHGVAPECITLGNGSNDVLVLLAQAFLGPGIEAVYSRYAFAVYPIAVQAAGAVHRVAEARPADDEVAPYGHDLDAMGALVGEKTRLVFIANPNNPTGTWLPGEAVREFIEAVPRDTLVVLDQAYLDYVRDPAYANAAEWLERYPNLVVTQTFSKAYGLAGLRVGYSLSHPEVAEVLNRLRQPFNVNSLALEAAEAALGDPGHVEHCVQVNNAERARVAAACARQGMSVVPSACNFVLVDTGRDAAGLYEALLQEGVIVRPVGNYGLPRHLRISIGTPRENDRFIVALETVAAGE